MAMKFDLRIGAVTTPNELQLVFNNIFLQYHLGVNYEVFDSYIVRTQGGESFEVEGNEEIVYLGFGQWKKQRGATTNEL
ncbi:hypothetical protein DM469_00740 [Lactobacillus helveticus]|uniref:hypothetical protein n=1 Tax=Lactobacillus helveticus TaxID=1587 RepID=UPI000D7C9EDD|nr:hypothetical protein [Lactobacillus helveticus]PXZ24329.1 hypothetical protein DM468_01050 [Lactobacillus helveticus]PXZ27653.1 hypothetical protein DM472_00740 [Lactobacillus helveticus]PXZ31456.1 hypothetical protein DM467_00740 [Lactobacillus helveticus]PXZ36231.1 hypothetical protein DM469_00740 [Lactobacillus helveticus]PXZ37805.1 hypothetical protein DM466_00740 [Lactobacillus helveticus]